MSQKDYEYASNASELVMWFCTSCRPKVGMTLDVYDDVRQEHENMKIKVRTIESRVEGVENRVDSLESQGGAVHNKVSFLENKIKEMHNTVEKVVLERLDEVRAEEVEKDKRKKNIIIHMFPEGESSNIEETKEHDTRELLKVLKKHTEVNLESAEITNIFRIGKQDNNNRNPRLLCVTLSTVERKWEIIEIASKLKEASEEIIQKMFISPDMTFKERNENKKIRNELAARRNRGEKDLVIRRGKIVKRQKTRGPQGEYVDDHSSANGSAKPEYGNGDSTEPAKNSQHSRQEGDR